MRTITLIGVPLIAFEEVPLMKYQIPLKTSDEALLCLRTIQDAKQNIGIYAHHPDETAEDNNRYWNLLREIFQTLNIKPILLNDPLKHKEHVRMVASRRKDLPKSTWPATEMVLNRYKRVTTAGEVIDSMLKNNVGLAIVPSEIIFALCHENTIADEKIFEFEKIFKVTPDEISLQKTIHALISKRDRVIESPDGGSYSFISNPDIPPVETFLSEAETDDRLKNYLFRKTMTIEWFEEEKKPSYTGTWGDFPIQGKYTMYVTKHEGSHIEGIIEEDLGYAFFSGEDSGTSIHFTKEYFEEAIKKGRAPGKIDYIFETEKGSIFHGEFSGIGCGKGPSTLKRC